MKRIIIFFILISVVTTYAHNKETFLRANNLYHAGEYEQALASYESMSAKGSAVWLNIGNCWYYLNKYAQALVAYKRALRDANSIQCATSLAYQKKVLQQIDRYVEPSMSQKMYAYILCKTAGISLFIMQLLFLLAWFILWWLIMHIKRRLHYFILILLCAVLVLISGVVVYGKYKMHMQRIAIVAQEEVSVLSGPDIRYHIRGSFAYGQEVEIEEQKNEWCKVRYYTRVGWVPVDALLPV